MPTRYQNMTAEQKKQANIRNQKWKEKHRDKVLEYKRTHYANNRDKYLTLERDRQYRVRYGITLVIYDEMLKAQNGRCKICDADKAGNVNQCFAVDHCHVTGRVRGLLCIKCNARLGWYEKYREQTNSYLTETLGTTSLTGFHHLSGSVL